MSELRERRNEWSLEEKVAFLSRPEAYPDRTGRVETKQTHMSWVFLTETEAWKLKKPVRTAYLDFSTQEARRRNCEKEVRLNRRLAPDVYRGVVPLAAGGQDNLQLDGPGKPVDWLVCMRRLPSDRMLDEMIAQRTVDEEDLLRLASVLSAFYKKALPVPTAGPQYRKRLLVHLEAARNELLKPEYRLPAGLVETIAGAELEFLQQNPALFDSRAHEGKIVDAHGDLRPEHVCLEGRQPVIIDCLEFNRSLRILDAASELMFLALECARLGAPNIEHILFKRYREDTCDRPSKGLLAFYWAYHAFVRAKIAIWHLKDDAIPDTSKWIAKAEQYLQLAACLSKAA